MNFVTKQNLMNVLAVAAIFVGFNLSSNAGEAQKQDTAGWNADPKVVDALARKNTKGTYREKDVPPYTLQDPLLCEDGTRVTTAQQWEQKRRPELLEMFRKYVYGRSPGPG